MSDLKALLISMSSHEIFNSLSVILCAVTFLQETEGSAGDPRMKGTYDAIRNNVNALVVAATHLLNLGRMGGRLALNMARADVGLPVRQSAERLEVLCQTKAIRLRVECPDAPVFAEADSEALSFALAALLGGVIALTPRNGQISVGASRDPKDPKSARVFLRSGGMSAEDARGLLAGKCRADAGRKGERTAASLALVNKILKAHSSQLELEEAGERFSLSFSLPPSSEVPSTAANFPAASANGGAHARKNGR